MDTNKNQLHLAVLGLNHTSSNVEVRDRLSFSAKKLDEALPALIALPAIHEALILSTCNRVEIYAAVSDPAEGRRSLLEFLSRFHSVSLTEFEKYVYFFHCKKAVEHLYIVVGSLDSMVIGETQILKQVKDAYSRACEVKTTGPLLNKAFHFALAAGKRIRTETRIGEGVVSISSVAVELAGKILGKLDHTAALIIGAGEMSKLTARHLNAAGVHKLYFANRTLDRAVEMAAKFGGTAMQLEQWSQAFTECDIVISSTGAPHFIITREQVKQLMIQRKNRPVFLIDIAAPRDIEPQVGDLYNVFLYSIDDLSEVIVGNTSLRSGEVGKAREIISDEVRKYMEWYNTLKILPVLVDLRKSFEEIRENEIKRYLSDIAVLPKESQEIFQQFAQSLTEKFLHTPSKVLKEKANNSDGHIFAGIISDLFGLKDNKSPDKHK